MNKDLTSTTCMVKKWYKKQTNIYKASERSYMSSYLLGTLGSRSKAMTTCKVLGKWSACSQLDGWLVCFFLLGLDKQGKQQKIYWCWEWLPHTNIRGRLLQVVIDWMDSLIEVVVNSLLIRILCSDVKLLAFIYWLKGVCDIHNTCYYDRGYVLWKKSSCWWF